MGLRKDVEIGNSGVVLGYWHLAQVVQRLDLKQIEVILHGYVSETAYKSQKRPGGSPLRYTLVADDFPAGTDLRAVHSRLLYMALKAKAATAAKLPRDGNQARLPEVNGVPTDPMLAGAEDVGVG